MLKFLFCLQVQVQSILLDKELEAMKGKEEFLNFSTKIIDDMEKASNFPKPDKNIAHFIEKYQTLNKLFDDSSLKSLKEIYNPNIDHIPLKDCNSAD